MPGAGANRERRVSSSRRAGRARRAASAPAANASSTREKSFQSMWCTCGSSRTSACLDHEVSGAFLCDAYGGAIGRVGADQTAFVHRGPLFCIQYYSGAATIGWVQQAWTKMRPFVSGKAYQNYIDPDLQGWEQAYYGGNLARLKATRMRVDPHHYFNFPQAIGR